MILGKKSVDNKKITINFQACRDKRIIQVIGDHDDDFVDFASTFLMHLLIEFVSKI